MTALAALNAYPSMALDSAMSKVRNPHPDIGAPPHFPPYVVAEAKRLHAAAERAAEPATSRDWAEFLAPIAAVVANAPTKDGYVAACRAFEFAMPAMPRAVLSRDRQREAMRRFTFWPKPAELSVWLDAEAAPIWREIVVLRQVAQAKITPDEPPKPSMTDEERAAFEDLMTARIAAMKAAGIEQERARKPVKPCHLSGEQLRIAREQAAEAWRTRGLPWQAYPAKAEAPPPDPLAHPHATAALAVAPAMREHARRAREDA